VQQFKEKPAEKVARAYLQAGNCYWNAGMFVWTVSAIEKALASYAPEVFKPFEILDNPAADLCESLDKFYPDLKKISIDFAVMEKADNIYCLAAPFDWDDVGSWLAIERHHPHDAEANVSVGQTRFLDAQNNTVFDADGRMTAVLGLKDIVVVHTKDATLVCHKGSVEKIKSLLKILPDELK